MVRYGKSSMQWMKMNLRSFSMINHWYIQKRQVNSHYTQLLIIGLSYYWILLMEMFGMFNGHKTHIVEESSL